MNTIKKTIILKEKDANNKNIVIVTLQKKDGSIFGNVKSYSSTLKDDLVLGLKDSKKVYKQNIDMSTNQYKFKLNGSICLDDDIACVLIDNKSGNFTPLMMGKSTKNNLDIISSLRSSIEKLNCKKSTISETQLFSPPSIAEDLDLSTTIEAEEYSNAHIHRPSRPIDISSDEMPINDYNELQRKWTSPLHEMYSDDTDIISQISLEPENNYENTHEIAMSVDNPSELFESDDEMIEDAINDELKEDKEHEFYNMIKDQIDELFSTYPREKNLEALVDGSRWCKIDSNDAEKHYVVGLIEVDGDIKYICYGVPGDYSIEPPQEMRGYSQWLPTDIKNPYAFGYWVMYQDADSGENVLIN